MLKHSEECKIQLMFKGGLQKYIQIEDDDEMEIDSEDESAWERAIEMEFEESRANLSVLEVNGHENLRFMNIFITKTRWDSLLKGKDLKEIVKIAGTPSCNLNLHEIILYGRRYIHKICEVLDKGSIVVKRLLMSAGYDITSK